MCRVDPVLFRDFRIIIGVYAVNSLCVIISFSKLGVFIRCTMLRFVEILYVLLRWCVYFWFDSIQLLKILDVLL